MLATTSRGTRMAAAVALPVAGLLLSGCGSSTAGVGDPPVLHLGALAAPELAAPELAAADARAGGQAGTTAPVVDGQLPSGPDRAAVWRYTGTVDEAAVRTLARALGLSASPVRRAHGWLVTGPGELAVRMDGVGHWVYNRGPGAGCLHLDLEVADPDSVVACSPAPQRVPPAPATSTAWALAQAAPVLAAVGMSGITPVQSPWSPMTVLADPVVSGLPTTGVGTSIAVDGDGIVIAEGALGVPVLGDEYPLVPAKAALSTLTSLPRPMVGQPGAAGLACRESSNRNDIGSAPDTPDTPSLTAPKAATGGPGQPAGPGVATTTASPGEPAGPGVATATASPGEPVGPGAGCGGGAELVATGAQLGLTLGQDGTVATLVPAWFFTIQGQPSPWVLVAVAPQYLAPPPGITPPDPGIPTSPPVLPTAPAEPEQPPTQGSGGSTSSTG